MKETEHGFVLECCELDCDNRHFGTRFTSSHYHATQHLNTKHQTEVNTEPRGKWAKKRKTTTPICTTQISQFFKPICPMSSLASSSSTTVASPRSGSSQISGCNANHVDSIGSGGGQDDDVDSIGSGGGQDDDPEVKEVPPPPPPGNYADTPPMNMSGFSRATPKFPFIIGFHSLLQALIPSNPMLYLRRRVRL